MKVTLALAIACLLLAGAVQARRPGGAGAFAPHPARGPHPAGAPHPARPPRPARAPRAAVELEDLDFEDFEFKHRARGPHPAEAPHPARGPKPARAPGPHPGHHHGRH